MEEFKSILKGGALELGLNIGDEQIEKFEIYLRYLLEYNKHTNLTAITEPKSIAVKHFLDSIFLSEFIDLQDSTRIIDIGTGAGFPGVPLKIFSPQINLTLLDSSSKRVKFLTELMSKLGIKYDVFHKRAEELAKDEAFRDNFDYAVARAVAPLNILAEYCLPFVKVNGFFVAMKGPNAEEELKNAGNTIKLLNGQLYKTEKFELPYKNGARTLFFIEKLAPTPKKYPRSSAKINKYPL